jgi:tetratricopeptide (TPR) repeat protein
MHNLPRLKKNPEPIRLLVITLILLLPISWSCRNAHVEHDDAAMKKMLTLADSINHTVPEIADSLYRIILRDSCERNLIFYTQALMGLSTVLSNRGNFDSALLLLTKSSELASRLQDTALMLEVFIAKGNFYLGQGGGEKAYQSFNEGLKLAKAGGSKRHIYRFLLGLGTVQMDRGEFPEAVKTFTESVKITRMMGDEENLANALVNLSLTLNRLGENRSALIYMHQALALRKKLNLTREYAAGLQNLGIMYKNENQYDSAVMAYTSALEIFNQMHDSVNAIMVRYNIGIILKNQKNFTAAEAEFHQVLIFCRRKSIVIGQVLAYSALASVFEQTNRLNQALVAIDSAVYLARRDGLISNLPSFLVRRHQILAGMGNFREGYLAALETQQVNDSLLSIEKQKEIAKLSLKFQTEQKESENKLLKKDIEVQHFRVLLLSVGILLGLTVFGVVVWLLFIRHRQSIQRARLAEEKAERINQEKKSREMELEKTKLENQLTEQELVYQSLVQADLSRVNKSVYEILTPFAMRFSRKKDQEEYRNALQSLTHAAAKDPMADFELVFKQIHGSFYEKLLAVCPELSKSELQVCALLRLNLSSKDIARLTNLNLSSIEMTRYHIRKKLQMEQGENLTAYLITI